MKKIYYIALPLAILLIGGIHSCKPKEKVIMTVNNKPVTKSEFEAIFRKNDKTPKGEVTQQELDEYMVLFTNFKLKVTEAEELGLDTLRKFRDELEGYRKQLAKPYLVDNNMNDALIKEAYERLKTEVRASHYLVKCDPDAKPEDTLAAYNKAMAFRARVLKGEDFGTLAAAKDGSEDPSAVKNKGDLGYFSALQMVYPFETAAYKLKVGEVSMPVRTRFGYHILKVTDKRPSRGQIRVAHILIASKEDDPIDKKANAEKKAQEILLKARAGEDFTNLARTYSDDQSSAKKGGELPFFGPGRMVEEFENAAFSLQKDGDISEVLKTSYGYHIIKRLELKTLEPFEEKKNELKQRIQRDSRSFLPRKSFINKLKTKYGFKDMKNVADFYPVVDSLIFQSAWKETRASELNKVMFSFADKKYTQQDFARYLAKNQRKEKQQNIVNYLNNQYEKFTSDMLMEYEDTQLEKQYPEFRSLMKEYRDGILLFDLTDKKVWSKAVKDTAGLRAFYEKNKANYMHGDRYDVTIYTAANAEMAKQVRNDIEASRLTDEGLLEKYNRESQLNLKIDKGIYTKEDREVLTKIPLIDGLSQDVAMNNQVVFVRVGKRIPPAPKTLAEAKGPVTSDYQNYLEKQWLDELRAKYPVVVNKDVLYSIK